MNRTVAVTATGTVDAGVGEVFSVHMKGGADAATAVWRTGGSGGTVIAALGCAANTSVNHRFAGGIPYSNLHVTVTGTTPNVITEL